MRFTKDKFLAALQEMHDTSETKFMDAVANLNKEDPKSVSQLGISVGEMLAYQKVIDMLKN